MFDHKCEYFLYLLDSVQSFEDTKSIYILIVFFPQAVRFIKKSRKG